MANETPRLSGLAGSVTFLENAVRQAPQRLDADVGFTGAYAFESVLRVDGLSAEDRVGVAASSVIGVTGNTVSYDGKSIGQFYGGRGGTFTFSFNQLATAAAVEAVIEHLTYQNVSDTPAASRTLQLSIQDGAGDYAPGANGGRAHAVTVNVTPEPGLLLGWSKVPTFAENTVNETPQRLDTGVSLIGGRFAGGTLSVAGLLAEDRVGLAADDVIGLSGADVLYNGTIVGTFRGGQGSAFTVAFNAAATTSAVEAVVEHLTYANVSDTPTATRTLHLSIRDADGESVQAGFASQPDAINPFAGVTKYSYAAPALIDLNGDGRLDLVLGSSDGTLRSFLHGADGAFRSVVGTANPFHGIDVGDRSVPAFGDLNGDGHLDLVVAERSGTLRSFLGSADGTFNEAVGAANPFNGIGKPGNTTITLVDLNDDGRLDLVVGSFTRLHTYFQDTNGRYIEATDAANPFANIKGENLSINLDIAHAFADLNGDGRLDLLLGQKFSLEVHLRRPDGTFTIASGAEEIFSRDYFPGEGPSPAFGDLNGDGRPDLVLSDNDGNISFYTNGAGTSMTVTVTPESETPTFSGVQNAFNFAENTANAAPQRLDTDVDFFANVRGGTLTVGGALPEDRLGIAADGSVTLAGGVVLYDGVAIGRVSGGQGTPLRVSFGEAATRTAVEAVIERLTYQNLSDAPSATRTLTLDFLDATGLRTAPGTGYTVTVTPQNDLPTLSGVGGTLTLSATSAAPRPLFPDAAFEDADSLPSGLTISGLLAADRIAFAPDAVLKLVNSSVRHNGTVVAYLVRDDGALSISFTAAANTDIVSAILQRLTFETDTGVSSSRSLQVTVTDSVGGSVSPAPLTVSYDATPRLTGVDLGAHDGTLREGESVTLTLAFTGPITVIGSPLLTLSDGGTAIYESGSGSGSLVFRYVVEAGRNAADLTVTGFEPDGGLLQDGRGIALGPILAGGGFDPASTLAVDTLAPDAPSLNGEAATGLLRSPTPTLTGMAEAGARVLLVIDGTQTATVTAGTDGRFSYTVTDPLTLGSHTLIASAIDAAGNASTALSTGFAVVDAGAPASGPFGLKLATGDDAGRSASDGLTNKSTLTVSGYGVSGTSVQLFDDTNGNGVFDRGERSLGTATLVAGSFSKAVTLSGEGEHRIVAAQRSLDGLGAGSDPLTVTLDRSAPIVTDIAITGPGLTDGTGTLTVGQTAVFTLSLSEAVNLPAAGSSLFLTLSNGGRAIYDAAASDATHLAFSYTVLVNQVADDLLVTGARNYGTPLTDEAGNLFRFTGVLTDPDGTLTIDGLTGTSANESFRGTLGADTFHGLGGNDTYYVNHTDDLVFEDIGGGRDRVVTSVSYSLAFDQEIETLQVSDAAGTASLDLTGNGFAQSILGNAGDNRIEGGGGADNLYGRAGADTFVFRSASDSTLAGRDVIRDFSAAEGDTIDLSSIVTEASDGHFHFVDGATRFSGSDGELIVTQRGTVATVQGDLDGDRIADLVITVVTGGTALHAGDFLLA